jgi:hypothetical protein
MSAPTAEQRAAARAFCLNTPINTPTTGVKYYASHAFEDALADLFADRERAAFEAGRKSVFDSFKLLPVPASGNAGQVCAHSDVETFTGGWRCRTCGYSWAWSVTP